MSLPDEYSSILHYGNGVTTVWGFTYYLERPEDIRVYVKMNATSDFQLLSVDQYTLYQNSSKDGGTVTFTPALPNTGRIIIQRETPYTQATMLRNQRKYYADAVEDALDHVVQQVQQLRDRLNRAVVLSANTFQGQTEEIEAPEGSVFGFLNGKPRALILSDLYGWIPRDYITHLQFPQDNGVPAAMILAMQAAALYGLRWVIPSSTYIINQSITALVVGHLFIEFEPNAVLKAAPGFSQTVLFPKASLIDQASWEQYDITIMRPRIDCSEGYSPHGVGGGYCSAISLHYFRDYHVIGGYLYGGEEPDNDNADSGITSVCCGNGWIVGTHIRGFNDAAIYPGGNNDISEAGDGGPVRILNAVIERCGAVVAAKRQLCWLIYDNCDAIDNLSGVGTSEVYFGEGGGITAGRQLDVTNSRFVRTRGQCVLARGITKGKITDNRVIDIGRRYDGTDPAGRNAVFFHNDGAQNIVVARNIVENVEWVDHSGTDELGQPFPDNPLFMRFSNRIFDEVTYTHGNCTGGDNILRNILRYARFETSGGSHKFLNEDWGVGISEIALYPSNVHADTMVTWTRHDDNEFYRQIGDNVSTLGGWVSV